MSVSQDFAAARDLEPPTVTERVQRQLETQAPKTAARANVAIRLQRLEQLVLLCTDKVSALEARLDALEARSDENDQRHEGYLRSLAGHARELNALLDCFDVEVINYEDVAEPGTPFATQRSQNHHDHEDA